MEQKPPATPLGIAVDVTALGISVSTDDIDRQPASLLAAAASFAGSMTKFVASGFKMVDDGTHQLRMNHCSPCKFRQNTRCTLCRCFIDKKSLVAPGSGDKVPGTRLRFRGRFRGHNT